MYDENESFIDEGGHNEVVAFPALKAPEVSNDWAEYDGIEVHLSDPDFTIDEFASIMGLGRTRSYCENIVGRNFEGC